MNYKFNYFVSYECLAKCFYNNSSFIVLSISSAIQSSSREPDKYILQSKEDILCCVKLIFVSILTLNYRYL